MKKIFIIAALTLFVSPAFALTYEPGADAPTRNLSDYIKQYLDTPKGAIDWKVFGATKVNEVVEKTNGLENTYFTPGFKPNLKALNGKEITVKGFMFPLDETDNQKLFLFGPFPLNCPYQYHVGPALVIEVHADKNPVAFSYDPVTLTGTLELVDKDPENSTFYRLQNAKLIK